MGIAIHGPGTANSEFFYISKELSTELMYKFARIVNKDSLENSVVTSILRNRGINEAMRNAMPYLGTTTR